MAHTLIGTVTSDKRDKTITVSIVNRETHPLYRKQYTKTRKYTAHDEKNEAKMGDRVEIAQTAPISRGSVELKEDVNTVKEEKKVGADEAVRQARVAEKKAEKAGGEEA